MKHAFLGAGAIGGLLGTALGSLGEDITVIVRAESLPAYPSQLTLERPSGTLTAPVKVVSALTEPSDVLWIATKSYQLQTALQSVKVIPRMVVPLLNGVDHMMILRERFGHDQVIAASIAVEAEKTAAGHFLQRSPFVWLNLAQAAEPLLGAIGSRLGNLGFNCQFIANEQTLLWSKLCFLAPFALATSASGMNVGGVLADDGWKKKLETTVGEACAVANASGAKIDAAQIWSLSSTAPASMRSSMQKDLAAHRPLELDAIGGPIVRGGELHGIDVSTTVALMASIEALVAA